jgi:hypothetical protein
MAGVRSSSGVAGPDKQCAQMVRTHEHRKGKGREGAMAHRLALAWIINNSIN